MRTAPETAAVTAGLTAAASPEPIWAPEPHTATRSAIARFAALAAGAYGAEIDDVRDYTALWRWSVEHAEDYWAAVWDFFEIHSPARYESVLADPVMPGASWFTGAQVNYAEHALRGRHPSGAAALICVREDGKTQELTWPELRRQVAALGAALRGIGVSAGDRVVGYLPPGPQAVVAFLSAASLGATWSQVAQDYTAEAALDRFRQLDPVVLITADGYRYNGKAHDRRAESAALAAGLGALRHVIDVGYLGLGAGAAGPLAHTPWADATAGDHELDFARVPFDHPLWVLFTSGTTGPPKGIVHGHGGITLGLSAFAGLQMNLGPGSRLLWYSSTNWVMWNIAVSALLTGATVVCYDGSPSYPHTGRLWEVAAEHNVTYLGTSPAYLNACERADLAPAARYDLSALATLGVTGAPLPAASCSWAHQHVGPRVQVASVSGGTDVAVGFAGSAPTTPVWPGELSAPCLGVALEAWDEKGEPVVGEVGELVVTRPIPSMPVGLWGDPDGSRLHEAYYARFPGVWRHGDWITLTPRNSVIIHGRSDATLNRNGIRLGTAEIYKAVEALPEIADALVLGVEQPDGGYWMPLFIVLSGGYALDDVLEVRIRATIRAHASPRHVPDEIVALDALPHTRTGKRLEVPLKRILQGAAPEQVLSPGSVDQPAAIQPFTALARRRGVRP